MQIWYAKVVRLIVCTAHRCRYIINENTNSVVYKDYNLLSTINKQLWNWVVPKIVSETIQYALNYNVTAQRGC